jgi:hypothetical protein
VSVIFTRDGFRALRLVVIVALVGLAVAIALVVGSYMYWQYEKSNDQQSVRTEAEAKNRVENARREQNDLRDSAQTYQRLTARGVFAAEQRLDLIEAMNALKDRHKLLELQYELAPQRPLKMANGGNYSAVDVLASRMKFKARAYHDGDLVAFLNDFPRIQRGFFPLDRCVMTRSADAERVENSVAQANQNVGTLPPPVRAAQAIAANVAQPTDFSNAITAECTLEWITLQDKRNPPRLAQAGSAPQ